MLRVAAVGDLHFGVESAGAYRRYCERLGDDADILLLAGDLTRLGDPAEARVAAEELRGLPVPVIAVLGNHDYQSDREQEVTRAFEDAGVRVLERSTTTLDVAGMRVGIAGAKGFCGGFVGACASDFGEPEMKAFIGHTRAVAEDLERCIQSLGNVDMRIVLLHYSPVEATLRGERLEIWPFLGSYLLAEAIDRAGADLAVHGHAHRGSEHGMTPGGVPVRNVAQPVINAAYSLYCFDKAGAAECGARETFAVPAT